MSQAVLAGTDFSARRGETVIVGSEARTEKERVRAPAGLRVPVPRRPAWHAGQSAAELEANERAAFLEWRRGMAELEENKGYLLTPFEKNLEVWRQLWRVLERSELVVQIVDARNPLLFRCEDLEAYVREMDSSKRCILLVNKADLLTLAQRKAWARHFRANNIGFAFWSAASAQEALEEEARREKAAWFGAGLGGGKAAAAAATAAALADADDDDDDDEEEDAVDIVDAAEERMRAAGVGAAEESDDDDDAEDEDDDDDDEDAMLRRMAGARAVGTSKEMSMASQLPETAGGGDEEDEGEEDEEGEEEEEEVVEDSHAGVQIALAESTSHDGDGDTRVLTRSQLLKHLLKVLPPRKDKTDERKPIIGLVGYPNVGKSSTVNVLVAAKKTSVSATPGKTKHFQTLAVPDLPDVTLCDCPGLVFPTLAGSKAQMVCDGILPIDQMKSDYLSPIRLMCERLHKSAFETSYALKLRTDEERAEDPDLPDLAREVLMAHALARGYMAAGKGTPDEQRSARILLKDLVNAKLLYTVPPPGADNDGAFATTANAHEESAIRGGATDGGRKVPSQPTAQRYLAQMKAEYEAQAGYGAHYQSTMGGRTKHGKARDPRFAAAGAGGHSGGQMQWRPAGQGAVPDRLVGAGPRVELG